MPTGWDHGDKVWNQRRQDSESAVSLPSTANCSATDDMRVLLLKMYVTPLPRSIAK
jgi:hypothetical protein